MNKNKKKYLMNDEHVWFKKTIGQDKKIRTVKYDVEECRQTTAMAKRYIRNFQSFASLLPLYYADEVNYSYLLPILFFIPNHTSSTSHAFIP